MCGKFIPWWCLITKKVCFQGLTFNTCLLLDENLFLSDAALNWAWFLKILYAAPLDLVTKYSASLGSLPLYLDSGVQKCTISYQIVFYLRLTFPRDSQPGPSSSRQSQNCASWAHSRRRWRATAVSRNWEITNSVQTSSLVGFYHLDKSSTTYSVLGLAEKVSSSLSSIPWSIPNGNWCFSAWVEMSWYLPK